MFLFLWCLVMFAVIGINILNWKENEKKKAAREKDYNEDRAYRKKAIAEAQAEKIARAARKSDLDLREEALAKREADTGQKQPT